MFTPSGIGVNGLEVECYLSVSGIGNVSYEASAGVGVDFVFVKGEATIDYGGSFSLTKEFTKTSPRFSGAGMSKDVIFKQCVNNYVKTWIGVELDNWAKEYSGLRLIQKSVQMLIGDLGLERKYVIQSNSVYCLYPNYDTASGYATGELRVFPETDSVKVQWTHYLQFWPDSTSEKLAVSDESVRPFLRELKDSSLTGDRLVQFFNSVVAPASQGDSRAKWNMERCWL